jgi:hypothetical protein
LPFKGANIAVWSSFKDWMDVYFLKSFFRKDMLLLFKATELTDWVAHVLLHNLGTNKSVSSTFRGLLSWPHPPDPVFALLPTHATLHEYCGMDTPPRFIQIHDFSFNINIWRTSQNCECTSNSTVIHAFHHRMPLYN